MKFFLLAIHRSQVIHFFSLKSRDILLRIGRQRRLGEKFRPRRFADARDEPVRPECLFVEKYSAAESALVHEFAVVIPIEAIDIDIQIAKQSDCFGAVLLGSGDRLRASIPDEKSISGM